MGDNLLPKCEGGGEHLTCVGKGRNHGFLDDEKLCEPFRCTLLFGARKVAQFDPKIASPDRHRKGGPPIKFKILAELFVSSNPKGNSRMLVLKLSLASFLRVRQLLQAELDHLLVGFIESEAWSSTFTSCLQLVLGVFEVLTIPTVSNGRWQHRIGGLRW